MTASVDDTAFTRVDPDVLPPRRPFGPGTRTWDEVGLITFSLTAGSAFLLQTMEPTISAVVDKYSTFRTDPVGRAVRSLSAVMTWTYGGEEALAETERLRTMHAPLNLLPERLRYFPIAYEARRLERDKAELRKVIAVRPV
ncbi:oxygenase MpaB family protein [Nocardia brevicatena]|uniref:oxygenase MpaB family protein n=1 Tax=Nocardia brevicatena TaxID=37327 RepID=UPI000309A2BA|nr:oxygenase MpaB family protein [Nocardia brevicatena]